MDKHLTLLAGVFMALLFLPYTVGLYAIASKHDIVISVGEIRFSIDVGESRALMKKEQDEAEKEAQKHMNRPPVSPDSIKLKGKNPNHGHIYTPEE